MWDFSQFIGMQGVSVKMVSEEACGIFHPFMG
jgi:hypothetical protein